MKFIKCLINQRLINDVTHEYEIKQVDGYLCGDKGLNIAKGYKKSWVISHQISGYKIFEIALPLKQVKEVIIVLSDVINWAVHEDLVLKQTGIETGKGKLLREIWLVKPETLQQTLDEVKTELDAKKPKKKIWEIA